MTIVEQSTKRGKQSATAVMGIVMALLLIAAPAFAQPANLAPRAHALLERADAAMKANDPIGALQAYGEAVRIDPRAASLDVIDRYSPPLYTAHDEPPASDALRASVATALRQYLALHPHDLTATRRLVDVLPPADGEAFLATLLKSAPNDAELYALRGKLRAAAGRRDEAAADFVRSANLDPKNPERHYTVGVVMYELAAKDENLAVARKKEMIGLGIAALERAEKLRENYFEAMTYRSLLLRAEGALETSEARKSELTRQADAILEQAKAIIRARRTAGRS